MDTTFHLIAFSHQLEETCRSVERTLALVPELAQLVLPVEVLNNFDGLPEAGRSQVVKDTCAAYRRSTRKIYINQETFFILEPLVQQAVFGHEIAHAFAHRDSMMEMSPNYAILGDFGEEFLADRLACKWGFFEGLRTERISSYGLPYVEALDQWQDEGAYIKAMHLWRTRRLAGIV